MNKQVFYPESDVLFTFGDRENIEKWCTSHPGNIIFSCNFCGVYQASTARCNMCECDPVSDVSKSSTKLMRK